uniref:Protein SMG8 n=2 Tax=Steinernema glaseri TaxID=37863 RepID=A0A1I7YY08_9BILA
MDGVPFAFCEHLSQLLSEALSNAKELSGSYGELARHMFEHQVRYACAVEDGSLTGDYVQYLGSGRRLETPKQIDAIRKKFVRDVWIFLMDAKTESVSREIIRRFPYADDYNFVLKSSSINEAWVDLAYSLRRLGSVSIRKELDDNALQLFQKLVTGQKLWFLFIHPDSCEGSTMEIPKSLLCQEQFKELVITEPRPVRPWKTTPVQELMELWSENSEKLRGKHLIVNDYCGHGIKQLEEFLVQRVQSASIIERVLEACSKEECDFIDKYHRNNYYTFPMPSCVYKFEEGEEGMRRRLYISFDCASDEVVSMHQQRPANHKGSNKIHLIRATKMFHILFD